MNLELKIDGLQEIESRLAELGAVVAGKAVRQGFRKASRPMFLAAKANALAVRDSGALAGGNGNMVSRAARRYLVVKFWHQ